MGGIWFRRSELVGILSEFVGRKAGLALTNDALHDHLDPASRSWWDAAPDAVVRIRTDEFDDMAAGLLHSVGAHDRPHAGSPAINLHLKFRDDQEKAAAYEDVMKAFFDAVKHAALTEPGKPINISPALAFAEQKYGALGKEISSSIVGEVRTSQHISPWCTFRRIEWKDVVELNELFESERLTTPHGTYVDQRFVNFLAANFASIDRMNWRKFEALTAEFYEREGYSVELGPGRNDGGVDLRVWNTDNDRTKRNPPLLIIQCKRHKDDVEEAVIKALWADLVWEGAASGLIVTSNRIAPGAKGMNFARHYPIELAERETVRRWIESLRTPWTGPFLAF